MSVELIDKGVSTEDLGTENVEEEETQEENSKEKEKKETSDYEKLEAVLSVLVENKVVSMREYSKNVKEKRKFFGRFRTKGDEANNAQSDAQNSKNRVNSASTNSSSCKHVCHQQHSRRSIIPRDSTEPRQYQAYLEYPQQSVDSESSHRLNPQQSFDSNEASQFSKHSDSCCCSHKTELGQRAEKRKFSVHQCLPKRLSTQQWLNSTSRQASTETATTSSGYISPTSGTINKKSHSIVTELDTHQLDLSNGTTNDVDNDTIIEISKIKAQKPLDDVEQKNCDDKSRSESKVFNDFPRNGLEYLNANDIRLQENKLKCDETCFMSLPPCLSTPYLPSSCRYSIPEDPRCYSHASYRHSHPSGGHYLSCCNSPTHSARSKFQYDENYLAIAMNLEDLEFEQEEERRKRRKRKKKRRKERQARARGLMADELKNVKKTAKVLDPEDLPKRARWTIVATACLLLLMSMLLVGVTLRMAPIIDEMVRKENEEMLNSLNRQGSFKETPPLNSTKPASAGNNSHHFQ